MNIIEVNSLIEDIEHNISIGEVSREQALYVLNSSIAGFSRGLTNSIIDTKFTVVPASIKYHGCYSGGLFDHSLQVAKELCMLTEALGLTWRLSRSAYVVGMFHDMCKVDNYIPKLTEDTDLLPWDYNNKKSPIPGHGIKSIFVLEDLGVSLTRQEKLCILHHMGAYEKNMWEEYDSAIKEENNVLWTHTADMYASKVKGV